MGGTTKTATRRVRALVAVAVVSASVVGLSAGAGAQTTDPTPTTVPAATNFSLAGASQSGQAVSIDTNISGDFGFCSNVNGLGAELYLRGTNGGNLTVRHATVSPFVVPLHLGVLNVASTDPAAAINEDFITIGVAQGTPVQFGSTGTANATYGGIYAGTTGVGMVSWNYAADITCADSLVMPILEPLLAPPTTVAPAPPA